MTYHPEIHHRRSIRLRDYDYSSAGAYFVTICAFEKGCRFGEVVGGEMQLNPVGEMVVEWWRKVPGKFSTAQLDTWIVMPNHFHAIVQLVGADPCVCPASQIHTDKATAGGHMGPPLHWSPPLHNPSLPGIVQWFKTMTSNALLRGINSSLWSSEPGRLWQRNYHEHVIRSDAELTAICDYIATNPLRWDEDEYR